MPKKKQKRSKTGGRAASKRAKRAGPIDDRALRQHLVELLRGGSAHVTFDRVLGGLPAELRGTRPARLPYSVWQLLEHLRVAQWDLLEFSRNPKYVSPKFPEDYWPQTDAPPDDATWQGSIKGFRADLKAMEKMVTDPSTDLFSRIPHGEGQTILREALLVADHNAYHLGQIVLVRRLLAAWSD